MSARRGSRLARLALALALSAPAVPLGAADEPLSFGFLEHPPGTRVSIGATRLHLHCRGGESAPPGTPTVLFESGLGGNALEWSPVGDALVDRARVCAYDRAGYGWSDPSLAARDAARLARELELLLGAAGVDGPFVVVAHSFGGLVARLFVESGADVAGLVLVDSSHEEQFARLETPGGRPMVPRNRQFVISGNDPPEGLPEDIRRKLAAFGRMRKTYSATHGEMAAFRDSVEQVRAARARRRGAYRLPVTVIRRGRAVYGASEAGAAKSAAWIELQEDLATLGTPGRLVVAEGSGHHVHADDPELVAREIARLLGPASVAGEASRAGAPEDTGPGSDGVGAAAGASASGVRDEP